MHTYTHTHIHAKYETWRVVHAHAHPSEPPSEQMAAPALTCALMTTGGGHGNAMVLLDELLSWRSEGPSRYNLSTIFSMVPFRV